MKAAEFNKQLRVRRAEAEQELPALTSAYEKILLRIDKSSLTQFRKQLTASPWQPPPEGNLLDEAAITAAAVPLVSRIHRRVVLKTAGPTLARLGIAWDVVNPFASALLEGAGQRTGTAVAEAVRPLLQETIMAGYQDGLSVKDTATALEEKLDKMRPVSAAMLARTDLNALANGSSVMAAQLVGVPYKLWVTASDEKVRETHRAANGQTVPVDQLFQVGGEQAMYPADPSLSDEEACNCRCTVVYSDGIPSLTAAATPDLSPLLAQTAEALAEANATMVRMEEALRAPRTREVTVTRNEFGEIDRMTIRET